MPDVESNVNTEAVKQGAPEKALFDFATAVDADGNAISVNDAGEMTGIPHNFNAKVHRKLTKQRGVFSTKPLYWGFKAQELHRQAAEKTAAAEELEHRAAVHGTPMTAEQKLVNSIRKLAAAAGGAEALMALLAGQTAAADADAVE